MYKVSFINNRKEWGKKTPNDVHSATGVILCDPLKSLSKTSGQQKIAN